VGLVAREIEWAGLSTVCLSNIPDLTESVGVSRLVGIEHPFGQTLGRPGDREGQSSVVGAMLDLFEDATDPGTVAYLPHRWTEERRTRQRRRMELPPIATYLKRHPWHFPRLLSRNIPE
jgi:D-proline reductase (dithiol) PrdB